MTDAAEGKSKARRATPALDVCVRVVFFAFAACWMLQVAQSETYHANTRSFEYASRGGLPFEFYAGEASILEGKANMRIFSRVALTGNVVFWAGCLGVSILLVHRKPDARITLLEFYLWLTLFCVGLSACLSGGAEQILYGGSVVGFSTLFCVTTVWNARRMADIYFDFMQGRYG